MSLLCMAWCGLSHRRSSFPHLSWGCSQLSICSTSIPSCRTVQAGFCYGPWYFILSFPLHWGNLDCWDGGISAKKHTVMLMNHKTDQANKQNQALCVKSFLEDVCSVLSWSRFVGNAAGAVKWPNRGGEGTLFAYFKEVSGLSIASCDWGEWVEKVNDAEMKANCKLQVGSLNALHRSGLF